MPTLMRVVALTLLALLAPRPNFARVHMNSEFDDEQQSDHDPPLARFRVTGAPEPD